MPGRQRVVIEIAPILEASVEWIAQKAEKVVDQIFPLAPSKCIEEEEECRLAKLRGNVAATKVQLVAPHSCRNARQTISITVALDLREGNN
jgi:hypothetical protein